MGHEQEKNLSNLTTSQSKYYCIATKEGQMMIMG
jgi:hypothetical protein